jgi:hypothetical protein
VEQSWVGAPLKRPECACCVVFSRHRGHRQPNNLACLRWKWSRGGAEWMERARHWESLEVEATPPPPSPSSTHQDPRAGDRREGLRHRIDENLGGRKEKEESTSTWTAPPYIPPPTRLSPPLPSFARPCLRFVLRLLDPREPIRIGKQCGPSHMKGRGVVVEMDLDAMLLRCPIRVAPQLVLPTHKPRRPCRWSSSCTPTPRPPPTPRRCCTASAPAPMGPLCSCTRTRPTLLLLLLLLACAAPCCRPHREQARWIHAGPCRAEG